MGRRPVVVCAGILNTKGDEVRFLAAEVEKHGGTPLVVDLSLGEESNWADIPLSRVLAAASIAKESVFSMDRTSAIEVVGGAAALLLASMQAEGAVDGIIAWAGGVGTTVATTAMRALPIGFPKVMLSTLASGDVSNWVGNKDIYMVNPISEKGVNRVTHGIIGRAAAAVVAMAKEPREAPTGAKPLCALTAYGTTTPTVARCQKHMEERGWDTIVIHQVGTGATMEDLIRSGHIAAVLDITTGELSNTLLGSVFGMPKGWSGRRLTAAGAMGIPQIVCPGGLEQVAYGPPDKVPESILAGYRDGTRQSYQGTAAPFPHNAAVCIVAPTDDEERALAREIAEKLNAAKGPTALVVPMRGWSAYDQPARSASIERGWAREKGDAPLWLPDPENPNWSVRARIMCEVFEREIDRRNSKLDFLMVDMHILDEAFGDFLSRCMDDMLDGRWRPGLYRDVAGVVR